MPSFNKFEYGLVIRSNIGQDVLTNEGLEMTIQPEVGASMNATANGFDIPVGAIVVKNPVVTVGEVDVEVGDETFLANEYLEYTIQPNDLSKSGIWRVKGSVNISATKRVVSDFVRFTVLA